MKYNTTSLWIKIAFVLAIILCLFPFVSAPIALLGGFLFTHFIGHPFASSNSQAVSWSLKVAVVGLGFGMNITDTLSAGKDGFFLTVSTIIMTLIIGFAIGKALQVDKKTSHLISSGTAICGGSAIAALAPVIKASEKNISIALGVVFLLNSIALLIFPAIGHFFELSQHQFGLWSAVAIHDTSSVVGASNEFGNEALQVATTVKLARALWIIPLSIVSIFLFKGKGKSIKIPWFIFLFIGAIIISSYANIPTQLVETITKSSKVLLVITLFLIGAGLSVKKIKSAGWKPMILGVSLWVIISITSLITIMMFL
jgi:uncharacterized integral membrane protein (TIGR00698 family)